MTIKFQFFILLFAGLLSCKSQQRAESISTRTPQLVAAMSDDTYIGTETIGRGGGPSDAFQRREALMDNASQEELLGLLDNKNPVVALTAFEGLCKKGYVTAPSLLSVFEEKYTPVHVIIGDVSYNMSTLEYAYGYVLGMPIPGDSNTREPVRHYDMDAEFKTRISSRIAAFQNQRME